MSISIECRDSSHDTLRRALIATFALMLGAGRALAADQSAPATSPPGLPAGADWSFNLDATIGAFGFGDSLYTNPKPEQPSGDLSDNWFEGSLTAGLSAQHTTEDSAQLYAKLSGVGVRTYGSAPALVGDDASSFDVEDMHIGWRSGTLLGELGENALDITFGRARYELGHGMLLWDGAADGSTRGGYWTGPRKAFEMATIVRFKPGSHTLEAFYLDKDDVPEADSHSKVAGANYEYALGEHTTLGATYMTWSANSEAPQRDGLDVYNLRAYTAPFPKLRALSFEAEYAQEDNGAALDSKAWNALVAYQFEKAWQLKLSYRYAFFAGDDPATTANEAFDSLFTGFSDWGAWWQGEIAGEYFVSNSNLISHQLRAHVTPVESISTGLIFYDFKLDQPASLGPQVSSDAVAYELDWYMDWSVNDNFTFSFVAAVADPGKAVEQSSGRTDTFVYGMIFAAYSY
jgi:hypothetical protein